MDNAFPLLYNIFQFVIILPMSLAVFYLLVFAIGGLFYKKRLKEKAVKTRRFAVLIPGYKEDDVIVEVANEALKQIYPTDFFDIVIIADSFHKSTIENLNKLPIKVFEVVFEKSTKAKALNKAMDLLPDLYDVALILDADNIMEHHFIEKVNEAFDKGYIAVQGHRAAKNLNTGLAILDAISEEINNHIFRKGHRAIGMSSGIIGSGMAFDYPYFKSIMKTVTAVGGFDKEIELRMMKEGHVIEYLEDAYVYDEKVQTSDAFTNQRRRWLSAQFYYFRQDIGKATWHLITKLNINYFDKAIQFIQPPRILLIGAVTGFAIVFSILNYFIGFNPNWNIAWLILFLTCVLAFLLSIPKSYYNRDTAKAVLGLPKGMLLMLGALLKIKGANKQFLHTKHNTSNLKSEQ